MLDGRCQGALGGIGRFASIGCDTVNRYLGTPLIGRFLLGLSRILTYNCSNYLALAVHPTYA